MSPLRLRFLGKAEQDIEEIFQFYLKQSPQAARRFLESVDQAVDQILALPSSGSPSLKSCRRVLLSHYPHGLFYIHDSHGVTVMAVLDLRQIPSGQSKRLEDRGE